MYVDIGCLSICFLTNLRDLNEVGIKLGPKITGGMNTFKSLKLTLFNVSHAGNLNFLPFNTLLFNNGYLILPSDINIEEISV